MSVKVTMFKTIRFVNVFVNKNNILCLTQDLEKELQQSKDSYDDLNDQKQELDGEVKFLKREMTKRDRAIHVCHCFNHFTKLISF